MIMSFYIDFNVIFLCEIILKSFSFRQKRKKIPIRLRLTLLI